MKEDLKEKLKQELDPVSYEVIVNKATERPHTGQYNLHFVDGQYACKACGEVLFDSS